MASGGLDKELRIALVGKTGVGKSCVGNSLIKQKQWFPSQKSPQSVTKKCKRGMTYLDDDTLMLIIDAPGLFDTSTPNSETIKEIVKCVALTSPGPHIFILVLGTSRFTDEDKNTINYLRDAFGEGVLEYTIAVFTGKDTLEDEDGDTQSIEEYVSNSDEFLRNLVNVECNGRYTAICNKVKSSTHETDVQSVINLIRNTVQENKGGYYAGRMYKDAEIVIKREIKRRSIKGFKLKQDKGREVHTGLEKGSSLNEQSIREEIITEIEEGNAETTSSEFWEELGNSTLSGIHSVASVVEIPAGFPLQRKKDNCMLSTL